MFHSGATTQREAFKFGIEQVNRDGNILMSTRLISVIETVDDAFAASKKGNLMFLNP